MSRENVNTIFDNVAFIVFNYDRCVEQFLCEALRVYYQLQPSQIIDVMGRLKIYPPYGQVGRLRAASELGGIGYGHEPSPEMLILLAQQIKTFTERVEEEGELAAFRQEITTANKLVFLGFAFHEINMKLLSTGKNCSNRSIYGTRFGVSDSDAAVITQRVRLMFKETLDPIRATVQEKMESSAREIQFSSMPVNLHKGTCTDLFSEYSMSIG